MIKKTLYAARKPLFIASITTSLSIPLSVLAATHPFAYIGLGQHPRVFVTWAAMADMARRVSSSGSFSAQYFVKLSGLIKNDLAARTDWDATYSGCDLNVYLHAFSYEPKGGYAGQVRSDAQMRAAMDAKPDLAPPYGAAPVAARLALYAALGKAGAHMAPGSVQPDQAAALAKRILLAWANRGFRDPNGHILNAVGGRCNGAGQLDWGDLGLQIGRGVVYSAHAQDLLQALGVLAPIEVTELNSFHAAMFDLVRSAADYRFTLPIMARPDMACERYSNHVGAQLLGLLSIARLLDDGPRFNAVLYGDDRSVDVAIPWTQYFEHAIYGRYDKPIGCHPNTGPDRLSSQPSFQTGIVAPGEIEDRYRNANPGQAFGYSLGTLDHLFNAAEIMTNAGMHAYGYRGARGQSIEMATQYYACYAEHVGFGKIVTNENARACPDSEQYVGQKVSAVEAAILIGAYRFPSNTATTALEAAARTETLKRPADFDPIRFGHWRD